MINRYIICCIQLTLLQQVISLYTVDVITTGNIFDHMITTGNIFDHTTDVITTGNIFDHTVDVITTGNIFE